MMGIGIQSIAFTPVGIDAFDKKDSRSLFAQRFRGGENVCMMDGRAAGGASGGGGRSAGDSVPFSDYIGNPGRLARVYEAEAKVQLKHQDDHQHFAVADRAAAERTDLPVGLRNEFTVSARAHDDAAKECNSNFAAAIKNAGQARELSAGSTGSWALPSRAFESPISRGWSDEGSNPIQQSAIHSNPRPRYP